MSKRWIIEMVSALLILTFVYTSLSKYYDFTSFKTVLRASPYIGNFNIIIAWALPAVELLIAMLLLFPKFRKVGLYCSLVIMSFFTLYIAAMLIIKADLPCQCGGIISSMTWPQHLVFNIFLTLLSLVGVLLERRSNAKRSFPDQAEVIIST